MAGDPPTVRVEVRVELKPGVLDAEASNVEKSLGLLGLGDVTGVTVAKLYTLDIAVSTAADAERIAQQAVERLLANPVIHRVSVRPVPT